ncbi:uncharacterized protein UHO2_02282 [Ustilago hordei]|uniref:uncharacterized protein n=1 Tax=Ustilago hordei TaxID=120017 RepID=UPI001A461D27|nr:uncharacterized protein UHO2_02282 [Ustilago hordei]SYW86048.1 uncharacterized protein UHO2_02282 [Ustilago hordei]
MPSDAVAKNAERVALPLLPTRHHTPYAYATAKPTSHCSRTGLTMMMMMCVSQSISGKAMVNGNSVETAWLHLTPVFLGEAGMIAERLSDLLSWHLLTAATVTLALLEFGRNSSLPLTRLARRLVHLAPPSTFPPPSTSLYLAPPSTSLYLAPPSTSLYLAPPSTSLYLAPPSTSLYLAPPSTSPPSTSLYLAPPSTSLYLAPPSTSLHLAVDQHQVPRSPCSFSASAFLIDSTRLNHPTCTTLS